MTAQVDDWDNHPGFNRNEKKFIRLDQNSWLKDHKVREKAASEGSHNRPAADEPEAGVPAGIISWVNQRARICREDVLQYLEDLHRDLADMENPEELVALEQQVVEKRGKAKIHVDQKVDEGLNRLTLLERELRDENVAYNDFRRENRLRRNPDETGRRSAIYYIWGAFILEIILNASMLMEVNAFGLLGSSVQMALICIVNVLIAAFCMGEVVRQMMHVNPVRKCLFSTLGTVVALGAGVFNLVVGHFRDSMSAVVGDPTADMLSVGGDTFERFLAGPFSFDSFQSALLSLMGFLFFAVAARKWWSRDDPYPGYGHRYRLLQEKQRVYVENFNVARGEVTATVDKYRSQLEDIRHDLQTKRVRWDEHCVAGRRIVDEFPVNLRQYHHDLNELLGAYYDANRATRTEPAPAWFSEQKEVDPEILEALPPFDPPEQKSLKNVWDRVHQVISDVKGMHEKALGRFRTVDQVLAGSDD